VAPDTLFNTPSDISPHVPPVEVPDLDPEPGEGWGLYSMKRESCQQWAAVLKCGDCGQTYNALLGCKLRTCPSCAKEYSEKIYREILEVVRRLKITDTCKLRMITLGYGTKKGMREGAKEASKALGKIWRSYLRPRLNPGKRPAQYGEAGAFASIEFGAKNNSVHLHVLYYGPWIDREKLQERWKKLTGSWYVDVRVCRGAKGIREVIKYISKGVVGNNYKGHMIEKALKGTRRIITYGMFYNRQEKIEDDMYKFTCPCCARTAWIFTGVVRKDHAIDQEIHHFRRLRRASLGGKIDDIWGCAPVGVT